MYGIIYKVTNLKNNKVYIGQTARSFSRRKREHIYQSKNPSKYRKPCVYFHNALSKYGVDSFRWEIIYTSDSKEELNKKEQEFISKFNSFGKSGYNLCIGGNSNLGYKLKYKRKGRTFTSEQREKISNSRTGIKLSEETKDKIRKTNLGKKASKETKLKMSSSLIGKGTKKIYCINNNTHYNSLTEAANELNLKISDICTVAKGRQKHTKGFRFKYA